MLAAVAGGPESDVLVAVGELVAAEIVFEIGVGTTRHYQFKHALVQDAAYETMLRGKRQELHRKIAQVLRQRFPIIAETEPGQLARHYAAAGDYADAAQFFQRAGIIAAQRSAMIEAQDQLERGLAAVEHVRDEDLKRRLEVGLRSALVFPLRATRGLGAPEVERNYERTHALVQAAGTSQNLLPSLYGLFAVVWARGDMDSAFERAEALAAHAGRGDDLSRLVANYALGLVDFFRGETVSGIDRLEGVLAQYEPAKHAPLALTYAIEFGVGAHNYLSLCQASAGRFGEALSSVERAVALARMLNHPFPLSHALGVGTATFAYRQDPVALLQWSQEAIKVSREQGFTPYLAIAQLLTGWAKTTQGHHDEGLSDLAEGIALWERGGYGLASPWFRTWQAEALLAAGRPSEALSVAESAVAAIEKSGQRRFLSQALTIKGDALVATKQPDAAEACFREGTAVARGFGAFGDALHTTKRHAALLAATGRGGFLAKDLESLLDMVDSSVDIPAIRDARALLR